MALVIFVFATVQMLDAGHEDARVDRRTRQRGGDPQGRRNRDPEPIDHQQANALEMHPAVALGPDGRPLVSKEAVVLISLVKTSTGKPSNVVIRGVSPTGPRCART